MGDRLCVGAAGVFAFYSLFNEVVFLVLGVDLVFEELLSFRGGLGEVLGVVEFSFNEFLLFFIIVGVYVDGVGRKFRIYELLWLVVFTGWGKVCGGLGWVGLGICGVFFTLEEDRFLFKFLRVVLEVSVYFLVRLYFVMFSVVCVYFFRSCFVFVFFLI